MAHASNSIPHNFTSVSKSVLKRAFPGSIVGLFLGLASFIPEAPGVKNSAQDLLAHATHLHPFILTFAGAIISLAVLIQGGDFGEDLENWLITPTLEFSSHLFSICLGALLPLGVMLDGPWGGSICAKSLGVSVTMVGLAIMAMVATAGLSIVDHRVDARKPTGKPKSKKTKVPDTAVASKWELRLTFLFFVGCLGTSVWTASFSNSTADMLHAGYSLLVSKCAAH